jgi:hypothetical protein
MSDFGADHLFFRMRGVVSQHINRGISVVVDRGISVIAERSVVKDNVFLSFSFSKEERCPSFMLYNSEATASSIFSGTAS